jgi:manganese-dependent inorganic pyrophosphatase
MYDLMGQDADRMPQAIKGVVLSCILSDTLEFRSPTTTNHDRDIANKLASDLGVDIPSYACEMFEAKSDISAFSDAELLRMDSKNYAVGHTKFRVSVLETTAPKVVLDRKDSLMESMRDVANQDGIDQVLLFVIDILRQEATFLIPNDLVKAVAQNSFGVDVSGDTVILPGIMSRKKQIIPNLKA